MIKIAQGLTIETLTAPIVGLRHHAHCSGIVAFPDGELLSVFYWAITEANRKQAIYGVRKMPGENTWSPPFLVSKDKPNRMEGNPAIWIAPDTGKLWLFYVSAFGGWSTCTPRFKTSDDRGHTWSKSTKLYWFISRGIKNPPILTSKGWYLLGAYVEFRDYFTVFFLSKDQGKIWRELPARVEVPPEHLPPGFSSEHKGRIVLQPTLVERADGSIFCLNRMSRPFGKMGQCESPDGGLTWTPATAGVLPNPGGGFHMLRLQSGNVAVIYNHSPTAETGDAFMRNPVSVALSEDEGRTWAYRRNLCEYHSDDPSQPDPFARSFGYPTMAQGADGRIHVTWSFSHPEDRDGQRFGFTDIQYTSFTEEWIKEQPFFEGPWDL